MMKMRIYLLVLSVVCVGGVVNAAAMTVKEMTILKNNVQELCLSPAKSGKHWQRESAAQGKLSSPLLFKILLKGELKGHVKLTETEKKGVQSVLKKHQASEHRNYRECVDKILPYLIEKPVVLEHQKASAGNHIKGDHNINIAGDAVVHGDVIHATTVTIGN